MTEKKKEQKKDDSIETRKFVGWLILDWKNGDMKIRKTKPKSKNVSPFEIPVKIDIDVKVPKRQQITAKGEVELSKSKVREMTLESI